MWLNTAYFSSYQRFSLHGRRGKERVEERVKVKRGSHRREENPGWGEK